MSDQDDDLSFVIEDMGNAVGEYHPQPTTNSEKSSTIDRLQADIEKEIKQIRAWEHQLHLQEEGAAVDQKQVEAKRVELEKVEQDFEASKSLIDETKDLLAAGKERVKGMLHQKLTEVAEMARKMERERLATEERLASLGLDGKPQVNGGRDFEAVVKPTPPLSTPNKSIATENAINKGVEKSNAPVIPSPNIQLDSRVEYAPTSPAYRILQKGKNSSADVHNDFGSGGFGDKGFGGGGFGNVKLEDDEFGDAGFGDDGLRSPAYHPTSPTYNSSDNAFGSGGGLGNSGGIGTTACNSDNFNKSGAISGGDSGGPKCINCGEDGHRKVDCLNLKSASGVGSFGNGGLRVAGFRNAGFASYGARNSAYGLAPRAVMDRSATGNSSAYGTGGRLGKSGGFGNTGSFNIATGGGGGRKCFSCGEEGHRKSECPHLQHGSGCFIGGVGSCRNCGQPGHIPRECPEPRKPRYRNIQAILCRICGQEGHRADVCSYDEGWD